MVRATSLGVGRWKLGVDERSHLRSHLIRCAMASARPSTLGEFRAAVSGGRVKRRPVRDEVRENLIARLRSGQPLFTGIIGYDDTVVPQIVNAVLSRHNFILLGLRGQAKSRILRALTG